MEFYTILSKYYDTIFPANPKEKKLLNNHISEKKANALDIGCGIGNTASYLKKHANHVVGIDVSSSMVEQAKINFPSIQFETLDMLQLDVLAPMTFDVITCFGNTLVHVNNYDVQRVLHHLKKLANHDTQLFIQIINYDRIYNHKITSLPTINNEYITMHRNYILNDDYLTFSSILLDKETNTSKKQSIPLYPLFYKQLISLLMDAGFKVMDSYSNFDQDPWHMDGYATIIHARNGGYNL